MEEKTKKTEKKVEKKRVSKTWEAIQKYKGTLIVNDPKYDSQLYISTESVKELVVGFNNKGLFSKRWKTAEEMVNAIENEYYITILPVRKEHIMTYARMTLNDAQGHKDPSDHVIIAHAITEALPLISSDTRFPFYRSQGLGLIVNER